MDDQQVGPEKGETYTCAMCDRTYIAGWTKEECLAEADAVFGDGECWDEGSDVVCDDCYQILTTQLRDEREVLIDLAQHGVPELD